MPGFNDTEATAVYPTNVGDTFRVPSVEHANGFTVHLEGEAGEGLIGPPGITPYAASVQVRNLTQFALVATVAPANAAGNIGVGEVWDAHDEEFLFEIPAGAGDYEPGDILEMIGLIRSGNQLGDATNDFSMVRSAICEVI